MTQWETLCFFFSGPLRVRGSLLGDSAMFLLNYKLWLWAWTRKGVTILAGIIEPDQKREVGLLIPSGGREVNIFHKVTQLVRDRVKQAAGYFIMKLHCSANWQFYWPGFGSTFCANLAQNSQPEAILFPLKFPKHRTQNYFWCCSINNWWINRSYVSVIPFPKEHKTHSHRLSHLI